MTDQRLILVTGASAGIGRAAAVRLASEGNHVLCLARSRKALEALDDDITARGGKCTLIPLDLKDGAAIDQLAGALLERYGRLDGLVGNAGVLGTIGPLQTVTPQSFEDTMAVNVTANWRLIRALHPLLRQSQAPRAVFVTSGVVPSPRAFWGPYQASKAALEHLVHAWADENERMPLRINLFDPGPTRTKMRFDAMPGEDQDTLPSPDEVAMALCPLVSAAETRHNARVRFRAG